VTNTSVFAHGDDQRLFEATTKRFLEAACPLDGLRDLSALPAGYEPTFWRQGAELGWTSLLVPSELGGGSLSEHGVRDLTLVAYQFGLHAAPGPLLGSNVAAAAIGRWGSAQQQAGPLQELQRGEATGAWAPAEAPPHQALGDLAIDSTETAGGFLLDGSTSPVEGGLHATYLLLAARTGSGLSLFLLPNNAPGLEGTALQSLDLTKRFARFRFDSVLTEGAALVGPAGEADEAVRWLSDLAVTVQVAEMCGAMRWALDTTLEWAVNRYAFGRPLASYQEIKHRFADMMLWLQASHAIAGRAADAVDRDLPNRSEVVSAAKFYVGRYGPELMQDCVQLHGGIGITFDHHLHFFLRRVTTNTMLLGTPGQHAVRLTEMYEARMATP
jgi:alkylation response protein AidB-like acyl-CoA dehydrogenase